MTYDSLLLNCGGGIISTQKQSAQYAGSAALAIGIGGTGVAALAELKRKVYQQLVPDNPDQPVPRYQHIQMLAIDSDETDIVKQKGKGRLDKSSEFFSVQNPGLRAALSSKTSILDDPCMNWMNIDKINELLNPQGAGGVRQVGRYLLISKAASLYNKIAEKCTAALSGRGTSSLDVYIFAGISGGTGSGCFLDTCYIVRQVLQDKGWSAASNIMGFFFLPDVVTSKKAVAAEPAVVKWNNSNGYAAMKELDYLMELKCGHDRFYQNYGSFIVNTQEPPVDMCYLVSAIQSDGKVLENGFDYCINVTADYVMSYLAEVDMGKATAGGAGDNGLTMRGHLSNVTNGVSQLKRKYGANLSYHVLGASNAEIPMTQISTYLAARFYMRYQAEFGRDKVVLSKNDVDNWVRKLGLTAQNVSDALQSGCQPLFLPDVDKKMLASLGAMPKGTLPQPWGTPSNDWLDVCSGKRENNRAALNGKLESYDYTKTSNDSLLGKVFRQLHDLCIDPTYGPYYAAALLSHEGYDFFSAVDGAIKTAANQRDTALLQVTGNTSGGGLDELIVQASADFCSANFINQNRRYEEYKNAVEQRTMYANLAKVYDDTVTTLQKFRSDLLELRKHYYEPLVQMMDALYSTFKEDLNFLSSPAASAKVGYTWRILELRDVKPHLDKVIEALTPKQLVTDFLDYLLSEPDEWLSGDDSKISLFVSRHMEHVFQQEMNRSLQDYLFEKYPQAGGQVSVLAEEVEQDIIETIHRNATPMFWCDPNYQLINETFQTSSLSVPNNASAICTAADHFKSSHTSYVVRRTGLQDRIFALRFCSGVPLHAYQGIVLLKKDYDEAATAASGIGAHLYSATHRGNDNTGECEWRTFLPVPMPYSKNASLVPEGAQGLQLYEAGVACGAIAADAGGRYRILKSKDVEARHYTLQDFMKNERFQINALNNTLNELKAKRAALYTDPAEEIDLKNDGAVNLGPDVVERVRKDYFLHYPRLQEVVRQEIAKVQRIDEAIADLEQIQSQYNSYEQDLKTFSDLLFFKLIQCLDAKDKESYTRIAQIKYDYKDARGSSQTQVFTSKGMPYGIKYPVYQAFLTYQSLDPAARPRRDLDKLAKERAAGTLRDDDNWVAYQLSNLCSGDALRDLETETAETMEETKRANLLRFFFTLRRVIDDYKDNFSEEDWCREPGAAPASGTASAAQTSAAPVPPVPPTTLYVWDASTGHQLTVTSATPYYGLDTTTNAWVLLTEQMQVFDARVNAWVPLKLDAGGRVVL